MLKSLNDLASKDVPRVGVDFAFSMCKDQPVTLCAQDKEGHQVQVSGPLPQEALKAPTTEELVRRSLEKDGRDLLYAGWTALSAGRWADLPGFPAECPAAAGFGAADRAARRDRCKTIL